MLISSLFKKQNKTHFILYIIGGIGNQLFQFATAYAYAKKHNKNVYINIDSYSWVRWSENLGFDLYNIISQLSILPRSKWTILLSQSNSSSLFAKIIRRLFWLKGNVFIEKHLFKYDESFMHDESWDGILGYFQSPFYFESVKDEIISMIELPIHSQGALMYKNMIKSTGSTVAIHYRDYSDPISGSEKTKQIHGEPSLNYYKEAIDLIDKSISNPVYFIFSNNLNSARLKLSEIKGEVHFIDYQSNFNWEDMALMSICRHNIICNSSYSWWAAFLNKNIKKIVVAPKTWGNFLKDREGDLFPKEWILIDSP